MKKTLIIIVACLLIWAVPTDAQSRKSSRKPQKTETTKNTKSSSGQKKGTKTNSAKKTSGNKKESAPKNSKTLQNEQKNIKAEIDKTKKQIDENKQSTLKQLNSLDQLKGEIAVTTGNINNLTKEVHTIESQEKTASDSITALEETIARLKKECGRSLRDNRKNRRSLSEFDLIFSSSTFHQALKRSGRIRQANEKAMERTRLLKESISRLDEQRQRLTELRQQHNDKLADLSKENATLLSKQKETQTLVADLKKQGSALQQALIEKKKRMKALDDEITRLIAEEKRKAEEARRKEEARKAEEARKKEQQRKDQAGKTKTDRKPNQTQTPTDNKPLTGAGKATAKLGGTFASNKGGLMFPVAGKYNIVSYFGRNQHEDLPNVEIDNSGIDILTQPGTSARAVYDGMVSMIVNLGGSHNVVMVRHGEYITVYSNIKTPSVKKGDAVKAGQNIGIIYTDAADNNRTILHFEVRKETQKLNPLQWVKR